MLITPTVRVTRFAQLNPGELFFYEHKVGGCVGIAVQNPAQDGDMLLLPLGPNLPDGMRWPTFQTATRFTTISFGQEFAIQLPTDAGAWTEQEPSHESRALVVVNEHVYLRPSYDWSADRFLPCYVDVATGLIHATGKGATAQYTKPVGSAAFATKWAFVTTEEKPRVILSFSRPSEQMSKSI